MDYSNKWYVQKLLTNDKGQDASSISSFDSEEAAYVHYHQILAAYHNAEDVLYAKVQILKYDGVPIAISETVTHDIVQPEPETTE